MTFRSEKSWPTRGHTISQPHADEKAKDDEQVSEEADPGTRINAEGEEEQTNSQGRKENRQHKSKKKWGKANI